MFTDPHKNLKILGLQDGDVVVDLGAGTGFYSILAAQMNHGGKVYAVDAVKDFLATIRIKAKENKIYNLETILGNVEKLGGTKIGDAVADIVIASNVFFEVEDKNTFIKEIKRILKNHGRVLLIDWSPDSSLVSKGVVVPKGETKRFFEENGFVLSTEIDAGDHHYGMILVKNEK